MCLSNKEPLSLESRKLESTSKTVNMSWSFPKRREKEVCDWRCSPLCEKLLFEGDWWNWGWNHCTERWLAFITAQPRQVESQGLWGVTSVKWWGGLFLCHPWCLIQISGTLSKARRRNQMIGVTNDFKSIVVLKQSVVLWFCLHAKIILCFDPKPTEPPCCLHG